MTALPAKSAAFEAMVERAAIGVAAQDVAWVRDARAAALQAFVKAGLPHRKTEAWRYTDLRRHLAPQYTPVAANTGVGANGAAETMRLSEALESPGLWLRTLFEPSASAIGNLNLAFASEGALIRIPSGAVISEPISIHHDGPSAGAMSHARSLVQIEPGASATIVETIYADAAGFASSFLKIDVQDGAQLTHIRILETGAGAVWLGEDAVTLGQNATYALTQIAGGAGLARLEPAIALLGEGAAAHLSGATVGIESGHVDWRLAINHRARATLSRLAARTVLGGESFAAVQGGVSVAQEAQKTDSHQLAKALLLSARTQSVHKPELEIFADDVKCGHGAATGALSADQLFYLRARGVPESAARQLLVEGFLAEIVDTAPEGGVRSAAEAAVQRLLAAAIAGAS